MIRTVEYSLTYARSTAKLFKSVEHIKGRKDKIIEDFKSASATKIRRYDTRQI